MCDILGMSEWKIEFFLLMPVYWLVSGSTGGNVSVCEESSCDVVDGMHVLYILWQSTKASFTSRQYFRLVWFLSLSLISHSDLVRDLPSNQTLQGISVDVHTEQEASELLAMVDRFRNSEEEEEDDDDRTSMFLSCCHPWHHLRGFLIS